MIKINVVLKNIKWKKYLKNPNIFIKKKILKINKKNKTYKDKILICTLLLSGSPEIKKLNKKFRKKNKSTDILSFPSFGKEKLKSEIKNNKKIYLGDIIINLEKIKNKNEEFLFLEQFNELWIHGLTHLFGYKHKKDKDFYTMNRVEKRFLKYIN